MLSAAYRQASNPRADGLAADPSNALLWRMNPRRLDIEAYRDNLLAATGDLDLTPPALSASIDSPTNRHRTVYGTVSRTRLDTVLALYDFAEPNMTAPQRDQTTSPLQQLFVMNSPFLKQRAESLVAASRADDNRTTIIAMYRRVLARDPAETEITLALKYLDNATLTQYAQALLATNEVIFWP
jgi:hypothetical protein